MITDYLDGTPKHVLCPKSIFLKIEIWTQIEIF